MASSVEDEYVRLKAIDAKKFAKSSGGKGEDQALKDLGSLMNQAVGPLSLPGYKSDGFSLTTLQSPTEEGPSAEGLRFKGPKKSELLVSTPRLLGLPAAPEFLCKNDDLPRYVYASDAAGYAMGNLPVQTKAGLQASACLFLSAQDEGPFPPQDLVVNVSKANRIYIFHLPLTQDLSIPKCQKTWDDYEKKGQVAFSRYQASNLTDKGAFKEYQEMGEAGFKAFIACFKESVPTQSYAGALTAKAQTYIDLIASLN